VNWTKRFWPIWLIVVVITFLVPEGIALLDGDPESVPLTAWLTGAGLAGVTAVFGLWLFYHFKDRRES
jgi:hypothetical protein